MNTIFLPETIDVNNLCQQGSRLSGAVPLTKMDRLLEMLQPPYGQLDVTMTFSVDADHRRQIQCTLSTELNLQCERCLKAMPTPMILDFKLTAVSDSNAAEALPSHLDPVIIPENDDLELQSLLEDEIMLNLPLAPRHDPSDCSVKLSTSEKVAERKQPFEGLAVLMKTEE